MNFCYVMFEQVVDFAIQKVMKNRGVRFLLEDEKFIRAESSTR